MALTVKQELYGLCQEYIRVFFVIAPTSPLGLQFLGAKVGDKVNFRNEIYVVRELI